MNKYRVITEWGGYSRGKAEYIVEANSEEEAKELFWENEPDSKETVRDDTESEVESVDLLAQSALLEVMG